MTAQEYTDRERCRRDRCNAARRSQFADSDVPPPHIAADPDLAYAWALDRSVMTSETAKRRLRHLDWEMDRYGEKWSLTEIATTANDDTSNNRRPLPQPMSSVAAGVLRTV